MIEFFLDKMPSFFAPGEQPEDHEATNESSPTERVDLPEFMLL